MKLEQTTFPVPTRAQRQFTVPVAHPDGGYRSGEWVSATDAWNAFVASHPELGYRAGKWPFHNFLRLHRDALLRSDAIRRAKNRFWIAHLERFRCIAFECATGAAVVPVAASTAAVRPTVFAVPQPDAGNMALRSCAQQAKMSA